jgi:glycosyltransferase involved in cell wall biosynthesis
MSVQRDQNVSLLIYNYSMHLDHPIFSHQATVAELLSRQFFQTQVITADTPAKLSANVLKKSTFLSWPKANKVSKALRLYKAAIKAELGINPNVIFYHMTSVQSSLLGPIYKLLGKKQILWYAHASNSLSLKFSSFFMDRIVTSTKGSFPPGYKVTSIGQSIDVDLFRFKNRRKPDSALKVIHIGRLDESKNIRGMIEWFISHRKVLLLDSLTFVGEATRDNKHYIRGIERDFQYHIDRGEIVFLGPQPRAILAETMGHFDVFLHLFQGSLDKSILEATSVGLPVISTNLEFIRQFGTWSELNSTHYDFLQNEFEVLMHMSREAFQASILSRSNMVSKTHSLVAWIGKLSNLILEVR